MQKTTTTVVYLLIPLGMIQLLFFFYIYYWYSKDHIFSEDPSNHYSQSKHMLRKVFPQFEPIELEEINELKTDNSILNISSTPFKEKNSDISKKASITSAEIEEDEDDEATWEEIQASAERLGFKLTPRSFDVSDLPFPYEEEEPPFNDWIQQVVKRRTTFKAKRGVTFQVCAAAFGLDVAALKYLLYDVGLPVDMPQDNDHFRTALHCVANIQLLADANNRGQYIPMVTGNPNWLTKVFDPPLPIQDPNPMASDIVHSMEKAAVNCAKWLLRAGADPNVRDRGHASPLHLASYGGILGLVKILLENGADPTLINEDNRTAFHYALANGHAEVAHVLFNAGSCLDCPDIHGVRPIDLIDKPGPISPDEAIKYFNITQRPPRTIDRLKRPELYPNDKRGWKYGDGGWGSQRIPWAEDDMDCDYDAYWADEITGEEIFGYLARSSPVLIRGLLDDWPMVNVSTADQLKKLHGGIQTLLSNIPYADKFGGEGIWTNISAYIDMIREQKVPGGRSPWYMFRGHRVPHESESEDSIVPADVCTTPPKVATAMKMLHYRADEKPGTPLARITDVNLQWSLGIEGSGAPTHFHNVAWVGLMFGAKKWILQPPHNMIMSNQPPLIFYEDAIPKLKERGVRFTTCMQTAGDVVIVPECWGHGVVNVQPSISVAIEEINYIWRVRQNPNIVNRLPMNKRAYLVVHNAEAAEKDSRLN